MPRVHAASWLLADLTTGEVLATKAPHRRLPPASTLKTLTAVTLLPRLDPDKVYRARWSDVSAEGSHVGLVVGGTYTVHDLFNGMLLPSGNDAASALAHANGGWPKTLGQMNAEARRLGAHDTVAKNPSGLDQPGQVSSAYDLALIARAGLARDDFAEYVSTISADFPGQMPKKKGKKRPTYRIYNQNDLLYNGFQGAVGV
jgi:D-alanyl-D-alanine carboxypeptidase (penicillin-binding protein 5/6)